MNKINGLIEIRSLSPLYMKKIVKAHFKVWNSRKSMFRLEQKMVIQFKENNLPKITGVLIYIPRNYTNGPTKSTQIKIHEFSLTDLLCCIVLGGEKLNHFPL